MSLQRAFPKWNDRYVAFTSGRHVPVGSKAEQRTVVRVEVMI